MAKRDVELVIRARDQAGKAIQSVSDALKELSGQQADVAASGQRADSVLAALGTEFKRLNAEVAGLTALGKVAGQVEKAANSVARLEAEFAAASAEVKKLEAELAAAGGSLEKLAAASQTAKGALEQQERTLRDLTREQKVLDGQVDALKSGYAQLLAEFRKAKSPSDELRLSLKQQGIALQNALAAQDQLAASVKRQTTAVAENRVAYTAAQTAIRTAESSQRKLATAAEEGAASLKEQQTALDLARQNFQELKGAADNAAGALGTVARSQEEVAESARRAAADVKRVADEIRRQGSVPAQAAQPTNAGGAAAATQAYRDQTQALQRLRDEFQEAQARVKALANEIKATAAPSQALRTEFVLAQSAARAAKTAYQEQTIAVENLRRGIATAKAVAETFGPVFQRISQEQAQSERNTRNASNAFQVFIQRLLGVDRASIQASQALNQVNAASRKAAAGVGTWGEETRKALSLGQRLRGEVLSIAAAYIGLFQAINQIGGLVSAFRVAEAASNRLGVVFQQDSAKVAAEMQFLAAQADRLGLNFSVLADEYSKFAIASAQVGISNRDTRDAFLAIAEAARVNKSTTEQLSGIYLAFTQILSKGKFTSEEVRRQLGDRLPGAFNLLADAIGVTGAELDRLLAAGELRANADTLLKFTDQLRKVFGGQLEKSLSNTTTELDRFQNTLFQTQLTIGRGGFIDALTEAVRELNKQFQTEEARQFFLGLGAFLGNAIKLLGSFVQNFDKVIKIAQIGVAILIGKFLIGALQGFSQLNVLSAQTVISINAATTSFTALASAAQRFVATRVATVVGGLGAAFTGLRGGLTLTNVQLRLTTAALLTFRVAATAAATAATALWKAVGGFPGLLIAGATFLLSELFFKLASKVPDATQALEEHERQVIAVAGAYQRAKKDADGFIEALGEVEGVTRAQADKTLRDLEVAYQDAFKTARSEVQALANEVLALQRFTRPSPEVAAQAAQIKNLFDEFRAGTINAKEAQAQIDDLYQTLEDPTLKRVLQDFQAINIGLRESETRFGRQAVIAQALGSTYEDLTDIIDRFGISTNFLTGELDDVTGRLAAAEVAAEKYRNALQNLLEANPETKGERDRAKRIQEIETAFNDAINALNANPDATVDQYAEVSRARNDALAALNRETDAYKEQLRLQEERARAEKARLEQIRKATEELEFQIAQSKRSERDQAIAASLRSAGLDFGATGVGADRIRSLSGQIFDEEEGEKQKALLRDLQDELDKILEKEVSRDQFILNEALRDGVDLATEFGRQYAEIVGQIFDANEAIAEQRRQQENLRDLIDTVRNIEAERNNLVRELQQAIQDGNLPQANLLREQLAAANLQLGEAKQNAIELATALGDTRALTSLAKVRTDVGALKEDLFSLGDLQRDFAQGAAQAFASVGDVLGQWIDGTEKFGSGLVAVRDAFRSFAADFLRQIAQMITQQLILNALQASGFGGGATGFLNALVRHSGGLVGIGGSGRMVNPALFANAMKYHTGGVAGLSPNEVPAILRKGEEVLTEDDPRHMFNGGGSGRGDIKIVNTIDPGEFVSQGLSSSEGEQAILNFIRSNKTAVRSAMGV